MTAVKTGLFLWRQKSPKRRLHPLSAFISSTLSQHLLSSLSSSSWRTFSITSDTLPSKLNMSLSFTSLQPLIKLHLSVSCPSYYSKVTHSIISSLIHSNLPFPAPVPAASVSNMSWGKLRRLCSPVPLCVYVCVCVWGGGVTLWMASFRGAINRECPWAVHLSYYFALQKKQSGNIERKAFEGTQWKSRCHGMCDVCLYTI